jgi:hypothetical protein
MIDLGFTGDRPKIDRATIERIRGWTRALAALPETAHIMVTELQCSEPGCPPVETVIAVLADRGETRQYKVFRPAAEVTAEDVRRALAGPPVSGAGHVPAAGGAA